MSISGAFEASIRIGAASGVQRFSPARLRNRPVRVCVRGSMVAVGLFIVGEKNRGGDEPPPEPARTKGRVKLL
jgi:hypothetical protein